MQSALASRKGQASRSAGAATGAAAPVQLQKGAPAGVPVLMASTPRAAREAVQNDELGAEPLAEEAIAEEAIAEEEGGERQLEARAKLQAEAKSEADAQPRAQVQEKCSECAAEDAERRVAMAPADDDAGDDDGGDDEGAEIEAPEAAPPAAVQSECAACSAQPAVQRECAACAGESPVQAACAACAAHDDELQRSGGEGAGAGRDIHDVAQGGVAGASEPLPHFERIQAAFGHHDVGSVKTQSGGAAAQASRDIGARAYTMGDRIGFGAAPDLHLAAHEAAHTVQQRAGVQLEGGVGRPGDRYEQQADRAADAVVEGRSAEGILDQNAGAGSAPGASAGEDAGAGSAAGSGGVQMELEVTERAELGGPLPASAAGGAGAPSGAAPAGASAAGAAPAAEAAAAEAGEAIDAGEGGAAAGGAEAAGSGSRPSGARAGAKASAGAAQAALGGAAREAAREASHGASPDEMASDAAAGDDRVSGASQDSTSEAAAVTSEPDADGDEEQTSAPETASAEAGASTSLQARAAARSESASAPVQLLAESLPLPASTTGCGDIHHPREAPPDRDSEDPPPEPPGGSVDEQIRAREEEELAAEELPCEDIAAGAEAAQCSAEQQSSEMSSSAESSSAEPTTSAPGEGSGAPDAAAADGGGAGASETSGGEAGGGAASADGAAGGGASAGAEDRTADAEAARAEAVAAFDASRAEIAEATRGAAAIAGLPFAFQERPGAGPEYQQDRQAATGVLEDFLADGAARYRDLLAKGETAIPGTLGELSGEARASIESAGTASEAAISARINQARLAVIAKSAESTARVASAYGVTVGAIEGATADAVSEIEASFAYESPRIGEVRDDGITRIQQAYDDAEANYLRIGADAKTYAVQRGEDFASAYDICCANHAKCSRNEKDDFWDGRLTVRRVKVAKQAARETAKGYGDELEKSAQRQARQARIGLPRDRHTARCSAEAYLENMEAQKQTALSQVQSAHQAALAAAASAFASAQAQILRQSAAALSQLAAQERQQLSAARDTTYMQIVAGEQLAFAAAAALQAGVAQAAGGVREGYAAVARAIDGTEAPPAAVLSELLGAARQTMASKLEQLDEQLELGLGDIAGQIREHTDNALGTLAALVGSNDSVTGQLQTGAVDGLEQLTAGVEGALSEQAAQHTSAVSGMAIGAAQTFTGLVTALENQLTSQIQGIESRFREAATNLQDGLDETLRGMDAKIAEKASDAAYHEPPAWKTVVKWVLIIAIVVVIAVVAGPALIGFLGGLGMSAFGAAVVGGAILGAVSGGLIQVINNWETNRTWHEGVGRAIIMGAITGAIGGGLGAWAGNAFNASQSALREFFVNVGVDVFMNVLDVGHQLLTNGFDFSKIGWTDLAIGMALSLGTNALGAHPRVRAINQRVHGAGEAAGRRVAGRPPAPGGAHAPTPHESAADSPSAGEPHAGTESAPAARETSETPAPRDTSETPAPRDTSEAPAPRDTSEAPAPRDTSEAPAPRETGEAPAPRDGAEAPAPRDTSEAPAPRDASEAPAPRDTSEAPAPRGAPEPEANAAPAPPERRPKMTGADTTTDPPNPAAARKYEAIRNNPHDVPAVAKEMGVSEAAAQRVKDHLFVSEHDIPTAAGPTRERFEPVEQFADAWTAAERGTLTPDQRAFLKDLMTHENVEARLHAEGTPVYDPNLRFDATGYPQHTFGDAGAHSKAVVAERGFRPADVDRMTPAQRETMLRPMMEAALEIHGSYSPEALANMHPDARAVHDRIMAERAAARAPEATSDATGGAARTPEASDATAPRTDAETAPPRADDASAAPARPAEDPTPRTPAPDAEGATPRIDETSGRAPPSDEPATAKTASESPGDASPSAARHDEAVIGRQIEVTIDGETHTISIRKMGDKLIITICSNQCGEVILKVRRMQRGLEPGSAAWKRLEALAARALALDATINDVTPRSPKEAVDAADAALASLRDDIVAIQNEHPQLVDPNVPAAPAGTRDAPASASGKRVDIAEHLPPSAERVGEQHSIDLSKQEITFPPDLPPAKDGVEYVYVLRDKLTGEILKVGETADVQERAVVYRRAGANAMGRQVVMEVQAVKVGTEAHPTARSVEDPLRTSIEKGIATERGDAAVPDNTPILPWDRQNRLPGEPRGPGIPGVRDHKMRTEEGYWWRERKWDKNAGPAPPPPPAPPRELPAWAVVDGQTTNEALAHARLGELLRQHGGNVAAVERALGIGRGTLASYLRHWNLTSADLMKLDPP